MQSLWELIKLDFLSGKFWFKKQTAAKLVVTVLYLAVLLCVGLGIFLWSKSFFGYLASYESFGSETALYVIKATVLILTWIGTLSSLITTVTFLLTPDKHTDLLLTIPVPDILISLRTGLRSLFVNFILYLVSVFPLLLTYFMTSNSLSFSVFYSAIILIVILLVSQSLGSSLGYLLGFFIRRKSGPLFGLLFASLLILFTWFLLRQIFPSELGLLTDLPIEQYSDFFYSLPLMTNFWLAGNALWIVLTALGLLLTSVFLQFLLFIPIRQAVKVHLFTIKKTESVGFRSLSLVRKDLLSLLRSPKDLSYLFFLLAMIVAFFGLFSRGYLVNSIPDRFRIEALAFSFAWLIFFSGTYFIRLTFPLMANEGQSRWWFFTLPILSLRQLWSKVVVSLFMSLPLLLVAWLEWNLLPFTLSAPFLILLSLLAILLLACIFPLIGAVYPDFTLAYHPDSASTGFTGLIGIIFVFIVGLLGGWLILEALRGTLSAGLAINGFLTFGLLASISTGVLALEQTERYTVDV